MLTSARLSGMVILGVHCSISVIKTESMSIMICRLETLNLNVESSGEHGEIKTNLSLQPSIFGRRIPGINH
jgi:hypothetical protein